MARWKSGRGADAGCLGWGVVGLLVVAVVLRAPALRVGFLVLALFLLFRAALRVLGKDQYVGSVGISLDLESSPTFARDRSALTALTAKRGAFLGGSVIWNYTASDGVERGTSLPMTLKRVPRTSPAANRFQMADPRVALAAPGSQSGLPFALLAPGALIVSGGGASVKAYAWRRLATTIGPTLVWQRMDSLARGAKTVRASWQHAHPDGSPDRRYRDNPRTALVEYWDLALSSAGAEVLRLRFLHEQLAREFVHQLALGSERSAAGTHAGTGPRAGTRAYSTSGSRARGGPDPTGGPYSGGGPGAGARTSTGTGDRRTWQQAASAAHPRTPHEVLGVAPGADRATIRAAYIRLAKQYHPDRVAHLAPEFRELAEGKMKEFNAAYEALGKP